MYKCQIDLPHKKFSPEEYLYEYYMVENPSLRENLIDRDGISSLLTSDNNMIFSFFDSDNSLIYRKNMKNNSIQFNCRYITIDNEFNFQYFNNRIENILYQFRHILE